MGVGYPTNPKVELKTNDGGRKVKLHVDVNEPSTINKWLNYLKLKFGPNMKKADKQGLTMKGIFAVAGVGCW